MGGEKRKKKTKPWNSFYSCNTTQKQMAVLQVKKIQDDKSNELTGKNPQQNTRNNGLNQTVKGLPTITN